MRQTSVIACAIVVATAVVTAIACSSSSSLRYPACERDDQCAVKGKHDYCVSGTCVYCRTSVDCGERERCRVGKCEADPDQPPPDAAADATDGGEDEDADSVESADENHARSVPSAIPRGVRRFLRP